MQKYAIILRNPFMNVTPGDLIIEPFKEKQNACKIKNVFIGCNIAVI